MNAKKIMGAVLVALLAAALFVGAGAANPTTVDGSTGAENYGTFFTYVPINNTTYTGIVEGVQYWANGKYVTPVATEEGDKVYFKGEFQADTYYIANVTDKTVMFMLASPDVDLDVNRCNNDETHTNGKSIIGKTVLTGTNVTFNIGVSKQLNETGYIFNDADVQLIRPDGAVILLSEADEYFAPNQNNCYKITDEAMYGEWGVRVILKSVADPLLPGAPTYSTVKYFTVGEVVESITADKAEILIGETVKITVTGDAGARVNVTYEDKLTYADAQVTVDGTTDYKNKKAVQLTLDDEGTATFVLEGAKEGTAKVTYEEADKSISIKVGEGTITAKLLDAEIYLGEDADLEGTYDSGNTVYFYMAGKNFDFAQIKKSIDGEQDGDALNAHVKSDGTWEQTITANMMKAIYDKNPDTGVYTIYVASNTGAADVKSLGTYTTVLLTLKQPFISFTEIPPAAVKGTTFKVTGTAEAAENVYVYIFGTNFFAAANCSDSGFFTDKYQTSGLCNNTLSADKAAQTAAENYAATATGAKWTGNTFTVKMNDDDTFTVEVKIPSESTSMGIGTYFMVAQHPMYDKVFNIAPTENAIVQNLNGDATTGSGATQIFSGEQRQTANAAEALCVAISNENFDDMYAKMTFEVENKRSTINAIPAEVSQGTQLTISGQTNMGKDKTVLVEILSTDFTAIPKADAGNGVYSSKTTKTDANGYWEVTFDTTELNIDEYVVTATVDGFGGETKNLNIIEGKVTPTEQPTEQPTETQPTQTEAPSTPGFGALAALAGLGAVAVLLLRRE